MFLQPYTHFCMDMKTAEQNAETQVSWQDMSSLVFTVQCSHRTKAAELGLPYQRANSPQFEVLDASRGRQKRFQDIFSPFPYHFILVVHPGLQNKVKATLLQLTFCPAVLGRNWHFLAIYLPTFAKMSLVFSEIQDILKN